MPWRWPMLWRWLLSGGCSPPYGPDREGTQARERRADPLPSMRFRWPRLLPRFPAILIAIGLLALWIGFCAKPSRDYSYPRAVGARGQPVWERYGVPFAFVGVKSKRLPNLGPRAARPYGFLPGMFLAGPGHRPNRSLWPGHGCRPAGIPRDSGRTQKEARPGRGRLTHYPADLPGPPVRCRGRLDSNLCLKPTYLRVSARDSLEGCHPTDTKTPLEQRLSAG